MDITINTPALLFPAISLIMLAYTNRFLSLASLVRKLHEEYKKEKTSPVLHGQIKNVRYRLKLIKNMQFLGVMSFVFGILSMYLIYINEMESARIAFAIAIVLFAASLILSLLEIQKSTKTLELELSDMEGLEDPTLIEYLKSKFDKEET